MSDPSYNEFCNSSQPGSGWPDDEIKALKMEVERIIGDNNPIEGCIVNAFTKQYKYDDLYDGINDISHQLQSCIDSCKKPVPQPRPQPDSQPDSQSSWTPSDIDNLNKTIQNFPINNTQKQTKNHNSHK
jgi:hypothetical protein